MLNTITTAILIGFFATAIWAPLLIQILYKMNIVMKVILMPDGTNEEFMKIHGHKFGTPTLGGLMISVTVGILSFFLIPDTNLRTVFILPFFLYTLYGLIEGLVTYARKLSVRFKTLQETFEWRLGKLLLLYLITILPLMLLQNYYGINSFILFGLVVPINMVSILIGGLFMVVAIYGMEIIDGADGLATGHFLIALASYLVLAFATGKYELFPIIGLLIGSSIVYLYFNINPARVFMGGTGTFPIAYSLLMFALITNTVDIFIIMGLVFWAEIISSALQIFSLKFRKKKLFKIAPIHHYFEAIGWPETKMVQRFWLAGICFALLSLWVYSIIR
jgi:phospho-N-acetylmuramoyl-pentapeptide-transferase